MVCLCCGQRAWHSVCVNDERTQHTVRICIMYKCIFSFSSTHFFTLILSAGFFIVAGSTLKYLLRSLSSFIHFFYSLPSSSPIAFIYLFYIYTEIAIVHSSERKFLSQFKKYLKSTLFTPEEKDCFLLVRRKYHFRLPLNPQFFVDPKLSNPFGKKEEMFRMK